MGGSGTACAQGGYAWTMLRTRMFAVVVLALGVGVLFLTGCTPKFSQEDVDESGISLAEVRALVERNKPGEVLLADARGSRAFAEGHIPGARSFAINRFSGTHGETDPSLEAFKTIVVYGDNPGSAAASGLALRMMSTGYKNVRTFFEGFDAWKRAGLPVESESPGVSPDASPDENAAPPSE